MTIADLTSFLRDDSPYSTMRIAMLLIIVIFVPCFTYVWVKVSLEIQALAEVPTGVQWLLGVLLGAKIAQKVIEIGPDAITAIKGVAVPATKDSDDKVAGQENKGK